MPRNSNVRVLCLLLFLVLGRPDVARAQQADDDVYVVQPGDTCASVGRRFFGDASAGSAKLHALNSMGPPPHTLKPGTRLRIKGDPDARLTFVKPEVNSKRAGKPDWLHANTGQGLWRLDSVNTLRSAGAEVTFRDLTRLQMNENALVVIYGQEAQASDKVKKSGAVELLQGELNVSLAELRGEPLGVKMPAATVDSRSRDLIVGVDAQQMTRLSVFDGQAEVAAQGQRVQVPRDHGTRVEKGKVPEKPRPLPEAPEWVGGVRSVRLLLEGAGVDETLPWAPVPRAASYRVELARDERFNDRLHSETVPAGPEPLKSVVPALAPGEYFARVRAVDAAGLLGRASAVRRVEVLRVKTQRGTLGPQGLQGAPPLEFSVDGAESLDARLDGAPVTLPLRVETPGAHTLELRPRGLPDAPAERLTLTVSLPKATLALEPLGETFQARLRVFDEQGQPLDVAPTALTLRGLEGTWVDALSRQTDGSWLALVVPSERDGRLVSVEALWGDTPLARLEAQAPLAVAPPPPPPPAAPAGPEVALTSALSAPPGGRRDASALPTAFLPRSLLVELRAQTGAAPSGEDVAGGRAALSVEGRLGERVALGAALAVRPDALSRELSASLSGRVLLSDLPTLRVLLSFEGLFAGSAFAGEARGAWLRPALIAGGQWERWAWSTSQGYALRPGRTRATWESAYQGWFLPLPTLALGAEVNALVDATLEAPGPHAYAAGVGARWKWSGFEVGASVRRGFGPEGARVWGTWGGQVSLGWSGLLPPLPQ
ncbi:FecR domain-containing protein [Cystobacter fuscus]|uniref:FecR domain-containing protein n=1 Tax=Cystobacter fuscus TaxID=43 RepID=UPI0012DCE2FD|nr:FecR domain-containing protein [Cystobacter fuscus]